MLICISNVGKGLKIWQQNSFCVRDEPFVISLMNCHNDKLFYKNQPSHMLSSAQPRFDSYGLLRAFLRQHAELDNPFHYRSGLL